MYALGPYATVTSQIKANFQSLGTKFLFREDMEKSLLMLCGHRIQSYMGKFFLFKLMLNDSKSVFSLFVCKEMNSIQMYNVEIIILVFFDWEEVEFER